MSSNPGISRRSFLTAASCLALRPVPVFGAEPDRRGPDLYLVPGGGPAAGYSTYARHRAAGTAAGMDFDISKEKRVYPVAAGIVEFSGEERVSGRVILIDHGFYVSRYAHLARLLVEEGERVTRKRQIGEAGQTGLGATLGPHLHVDIQAHAVFLISREGGDGAMSIDPSALIWLDPVDFAAYSARDLNQNPTLPYWQGESSDGVLDVTYRTHFESSRSAVDRLWSRAGLVRDRLPKAGLPAARMEFGRRLHGLYSLVRQGDDVPAGIEAAAVRDLVHGFFAIRPRITAPLRNPSPGADAHYR